MTRSLFDAADPQLSGDITVYAGSNSATLNNTSNVQSVVVGVNAAYGNAVLASGQFAPTTASVYPVSASVAAPLDTTHLTLSFVAPQSGKVLARGSGYVVGAGTGSPGMAWAVTTHGSGSLVGVLAPIFNASGYASTFVAEEVVSGLTPGTTYQWDWAACTLGGTGGSVIAQGATSGAPTGGPAVMEIIAL